MTAKEIEDLMKRIGDVFAEEVRIIRQQFEDIKAVYTGRPHEIADALKQDPIPSYGRHGFKIGPFPVHPKVWIMFRSVERTIEDRDEIIEGLRQELARYQDPK